MKDPKEILFDQMQPSGSGGIEITTEGILIAMEIYAKERAVKFMLQSGKSGNSRFEVERLYDIYSEKEPF